LRDAGGERYTELERASTSSVSAGRDRRATRRDRMQDTGQAMSH
jgi:hypothetical protein